MNATITHPASGSTLITIEGRLDTVTAPEFDLLVSRQEPDIADTDITISCSSLEYISSAGLRSLLSLLKKARLNNRTVTVTGLIQPIRAIFDMTGFTSLFNINPNDN